MNRAARKTQTLTAVFAALAWFAVLLQFYLSLQLALTNGKTIAGGILAYLGYFTVLTNILVCVALTLPLMAPASTLGRFFSRPSVVAGVAASIALVGITYHLLLRNVWAPQGLQWLADVLLHYAIPVLYVLYWWFAVPKDSLRWIDPLTWCIYPTAYLAYALVRGVLIDSYPYPFIDAATIGYQRTLFNAFGLLLVYIALGLLFVALGKANAASQARASRDE